MVTAPRTFGAKSRGEKVRDLREHDRRRGSARERGYDAAWDKASKAYRAAHPLCEYCALDGRVKPAQAVDHLYPFRIYGEKWRSDLWVATCHECHDGMKQAVEAAGHAAIARLARRLARPTLPRPAG